MSRTKRLVLQAIPDPALASAAKPLAPNSCASAQAKAFTVAARLESHGSRNRPSVYSRDLSLC